MNDCHHPAHATAIVAPSRRSFESFDGTRLSFLHWPSDSARARAVLLLHRGHEHAERLSHVAEVLSADGFSVYAPNMRGHGASDGAPGGGARLDHLVRDLDCLVRHLSDRDGVDPRNLALVGQSVGAVVGATWVHDYAPPVRAQVLAAPAFQIRLYVPFAETGIRLATRLFPDLRIKSYVTGQMLTQDETRAAQYDTDPRIARDITGALLTDLRDTARRIVADAAMIAVPTQLLIAGDDRVVDRAPMRSFFGALGAGLKEQKTYKGLRHDLFGERYNARVLADLRSFLGKAFAAPVRRDDLLSADEAGPSRTEADGLARPPERGSLVDLRWRAARAGVWIGSTLSKGMEIGRSAGFDSGAALDYVYRDRPTGFGPLGRMIDRIYLDAPGWKGIRQRRIHLEGLISEAVQRLHAAGRAPTVLDIAAGRGRYVLDLPPETLERVASIHLRDFCGRNVAAGRALIDERGLSRKATFEESDAFDAAALAACDPRPSLVIVSGLYELFASNALVRRSLGGVAQAVRPGGYLIYTNQPWHPQLEFIARALTSHRDGAPWVMRRRSQAEMDELVAEAGFTKLEQRIDRWGIFTVSLAQRQG
ncbi:MAG: bifunctional alpha/beta hydrolase/class I SAM-dependent methyltransferase [Pseudomonadota bacterium]